MASLVLEPSGCAPWRSWCQTNRKTMHNTAERTHHLFSTIIEILEPPQTLLLAWAWVHLTLSNKSHIGSPIDVWGGWYLCNTLQWNTRANVTNTKWPSQQDIPPPKHTVGSIQLKSAENLCYNNEWLGGYVWCAHHWRGVLKEHQIANFLAVSACQKCTFTTVSWSRLNIMAAQEVHAT